MAQLPLIRRVVARLLSSGAKLLVLLSLGFLLLSLAPGDPLQLADDPRFTPADRARQRAALGLDGALPERFGSYLSHALRGDLGLSLRYNQPVRELVGAALGPSLLLGGSALVIAFALGLVLGTRAAQRPRGASAFVVDRVLPLLDALPPFWLGLMAILVFAWKLGWLPVSHMHSAEGGGLLDLLRHMLLPVATLAIPGSAAVARHHAAALRRELHGPRARAEASLGLTPARRLWRASRLALHPSIVLLGLALPVMAGGTAVLETVFSWPGLGALQTAAFAARDLPLALGGLLVSALAVLVGGFVSTALAHWLDPRWRNDEPALEPGR